jgi:hypothetical protein
LLRDLRRLTGGLPVAAIRPVRGCAKSPRGARTAPPKLPTSMLASLRSFQRDLPDHQQCGQPIGHVCMKSDQESLSPKMPPWFACFYACLPGEPRTNGRLRPWAGAPEIGGLLNDIGTAQSTSQLPRSTDQPAKDRRFPHDDLPLSSTVYQPTDYAIS